jgi:nicotinamide mononucleotide transporter
MNMLRDWTMFEKVWIAVFAATNVYLFFAWQDSLLGLVTSITGMFCVVLAAKGRISTYYFGIIQTATYAYISYGYGLYGETMLNALFYFPVQFIGIYLWNKHKSHRMNGKGAEVEMKGLTRRGWLYVTISFTLVFGFYAFLLKGIGGSSIWIDSATTILSIVAQVLMLQRYKEQWLFWILVNVLSILLWLTTLITQGGNDVSMLVMWSAFLINSIYGYINWTKVYKKQMGRAA